MKRSHAALIRRDPRIGLALGAGFARDIARVGVLRVLDREKIPLYWVTGVSAGAIVAAAFASGATPDEIAAAGSAMRFADVAGWRVLQAGLVDSNRMSVLLRKLLKHLRFEDMCIPVGIMATDLRSGKPVVFRDRAEVVPAIRASCAYPGLFQPVKFGGQMLVDGAISVKVPALLARKMGAARVVSVGIPNRDETFEPQNMFDVINRSFQVIMAHNQDAWRKHSDLVISPQVASVPWDGFSSESARLMIEAGEQACESALPRIRQWLRERKKISFPNTGLVPAMRTGS